MFEIYEDSIVVEHEFMANIQNILKSSREAFPTKSSNICDAYKSSHF